MVKFKYFSEKNHPPLLEEHVYPKIAVFAHIFLNQKHPPRKEREKTVKMSRTRLRAGRIRWRLVSTKVWPWYRCLWKETKDDVRFVVVSFFFRWLVVGWLFRFLGVILEKHGKTKEWYFFFGLSDVFLLGRAVMFFFWGLCFGYTWGFLEAFFLGGWWRKWGKRGRFLFFLGDFWWSWWTRGVVWWSVRQFGIERLGWYGKFHTR